MGIFNNEIYYYFYTKNGVTEIKVLSIKINTQLYTRYEEMTEEQVSFYLEHPDASVDEIRNTQLNAVPVIDEQLEKVKQGAIAELKYIFSNRNQVNNEMLNAAVVDFLKQNNALTLKDVPDLMDNSESRNIIVQWATSYNESQQLLRQYTEQVNNSTDTESVLGIMENVRQLYYA